VKLEFGAITGVMPEAVRFGFEVLSKNGPAEGAELDIVIIPVKAVCLECSAEVLLERYDPFCPICSSPALKILEGRDEMRIASLEIEEFPPEPAVQSTSCGDAAPGTDED
jgi:hydrogenase nickel incorporation protein HypA/HybF